MTPLRKRMLEDMQLRNLAPKTRSNYIHYISGLAKFYMTSPHHLSFEEIRDYQLYLINERRYSEESVNQFVSAVKFLYGTTLEMPFPEGTLTRMRVPQRLPVILSPEEVSLFLDCIPTVRYRVAIMCAYGAGLRVSEVVCLRFSDIDSKRMVIRVEQGKGKKDRYTLLSPRLLEVLRFWWRSSKPKGLDSCVFPAWRAGHHLNAATLQRACQDAVKQAGLTKRVTPHSMRHAFATHLLENGTDIRVIQALLGHTRIETTARYTQVSPLLISQIKSPLDQLDPRFSAATKPTKKAKR
jgi:site-specific recombinase XerD